MEKYEGDWHLQRTVGEDEFLIAEGASWFKRKVIEAIHPYLSFTVSENGNKLSMGVRAPLTNVKKEVPLKDSSEKIMLAEYFFRYDFDCGDQILVYVSEEENDVELLFETHLAKNKFGQLEISVKDATEEPINEFKAFFTYS